MCIVSHQNYGKPMRISRIASSTDVFSQRLMRILLNLLRLLPGSTQKIVERCSYGEYIVKASGTFNDNTKIKDMPFKSFYNRETKEAVFVTLIRFKSVKFRSVFTGRKFEVS
jgi:hypothetical protein